MKIININRKITKLKKFDESVSNHKEPRLRNSVHSFCVKYARELMEEKRKIVKTLYHKNPNLAEKTGKRIDGITPKGEAFQHKTMTFNIGDKVKIVALESGHGFSVGEEVCIVQLDVENGDYEAANGGNTWWVDESEIIKC